MSQASKAKDAFAKARTYYESGLKSGNKKYDDNSDKWSWWKQLSGKAASRRAEQPLAQQVIKANRSSAYLKSLDTIKKGKYLYTTGARAGNCGELAEVSCYLLNKAGVPPNELAVAYVYTRNPAPGQKQADHAFCLYGPNKDLNWIAQNPALTSLTALNKNLMFSDIHALDPWANTCCTLDRYPGLIETKMNSWGSYGKRILWVYDPTVNPPLWEWCEPNGEYKDVFAAGSLALGIC